MLLLGPQLADKNGLSETDFFHVGVDTEPDANDPKRDYPVNPSFEDYPVNSFGDYARENLRSSRQANGEVYQDSSAQVNLTLTLVAI